MTKCIYLIAGLLLFIFNRQFRGLVWHKLKNSLDTTIHTRETVAAILKHKDKNDENSS